MSKKHQYWLRPYSIYKYLTGKLKFNSSKDKVFFYLLRADEQEKQRVHLKKLGMDPQSVNDDSISSYLKTKLLGAVKTTKESPYVRSLYGDSTSIPQNPVNEIDLIPADSSILLYPSYTKVESNEYITRIKGSIYCNGSMSTKNKLLLSLAQRLSKSSPPQLGEELEAELKDAIVNPDTMNESTTNTGNISTPIRPTTDTVKDRMKGILSRQIQKTPLNITVSSKNQVERLIAAKLYSDSFGMFEISLMTPYEPSYVVVESVLNPDIIQTISTTIIPEKGFSVITDIDDTVRETGVLGDKRDVFRNVFSKPYSECEIPGVCEWLTELHTDYKCSIHYVSNSPWQIYNIVDGFLNHFNFPISSIHLRQYSGNLISSFTQPSAERKRPSMVNLMNDFPNRKFILIGDSGEQDLEAYLSLLPMFEKQIKAIYIRVVPESLSSIGNENVLNELQHMLSTRGVKSTGFWNNPTGIDSDGEIDDSEDPVKKHNITKTLNGISSYGVRNSINKNVNEVTNELINATYDAGLGVGVAVASSDARAKLAPLVPKKPTILKGNRLTRRKSSTVEQEDVQNKEPTSNENDSSSSSLSSLVKTRTKSWSKERVSNILKMGEKIYQKPTQEDLIPPPLPMRKRGSTAIEEKPLSAQSKTSCNTSTPSTDYQSCKDDLTMSSNGTKVDGYNNEVEDKRRNLWRLKIKRIVDEVPDSIDVKLWVNVESVHDDSIKIILDEIYKDK